MLSMQKRVEKGAALLDEHYPGWAEKINGHILDGIFNMVEPEKCILGSLELVRGRYDDPDVHFNGTVITSWEVAIDYGFNTSIEDDERYGGSAIHAYNHLRDLWVNAVNERI